MSLARLFMAAALAMSASPALAEPGRLVLPSTELRFPTRAEVFTYRLQEACKPTPSPSAKVSALSTVSWQGVALVAIIATAVVLVRGAGDETTNYFVSG